MYLMCLISNGFPPKFVNQVKECITNPRFSIALNGSIWQGEPISHYLFVIAVEAFTRLLKIKVHDAGHFNFHPQFEHQQNTHLNFSDGLLIFVSVELLSIQLVKDALKDIREISGLVINPSKSEVFCAAIPTDLKSQILSFLRFKEGILLVKYLGLPLIPSKLSLKDCQPLLDKIVARITSWSSRKLSFSRRLQILQSIMYNI